MAGGTTAWEFELGAKVRDQVTELEGVIVARCEWLNGCLQYVVQPRGLHEGKKIESEWIDEGQLEETTEEAVRTAPSPGGGPQSYPA